MPHVSDQAERSAGSLAAAISNGVVRLLSEYTGRGPTKARTYLAHDLVSVLLQDTLTKGERTLLANGQTDLVLANRRAYQRTLAPQLIDCVQRLTGRTVLAFLSDDHIDPDYAVETFVLAPPQSAGREAGQAQAGDA